MVINDKYVRRGAYLAATIWALFLLLVHLPKLAMKINDGGEWTGTFEVVSLLSGALMLIRSANRAIFKIAKFLFVAALVVFGVQHCIYAGYVATLIPAWVPGHLFWTYVAMAGFFATAISLAINKFVRLSTSLLSVMFILWVLTLHIPRVLASSKIEPEWTSLFIAFAMSGIALLSARSSLTK